MSLLTTAEDRHQVSQGVFAYCRGLDRWDRALALSPFDEGARLLYMDIFDGTPAEFMDWVWPLHETMPVHIHRVANIYLERRDDGALISESYVQVVLRTPQPDGSFMDNVGNGRYVDRWAERDGVLRIVERLYIKDMARRYPFSEAPRVSTPQPDVAPLAWARDKSDGSYRLFEG